MKIISFYLPQFHEIPENNEWWGKGFTEWMNVSKAKKLFDGHIQPKVPLNSNYYNLLNDDVKVWQAELAKKYGIYGFCYYHYWFNGKMLLEKPMEQMLINPKIDIHFCISWANEHWTNGWVSDKEIVLIEQSYGGEVEWKEHFEYLKKFFDDPRYIKENNKPLLIIYKPELIGCLNEMLDYWEMLAKDAGFNGMCFAYQFVGFDLLDYKDDSRFTYNIEYQPIYAMQFGISSFYKFQRIVKKILMKIPFVTKVNRPLGVGKKKYNDIWNYIINTPPVSAKSIPGAFTNWDNTSRKGNNGIVILDSSTEKFEKYMEIQIKRAKELYKSDYLFMFAWNEWAEGGYLEPDEENGYGYLEAIKRVLIVNNEFPNTENS